MDLFFLEFVGFTESRNPSPGPRYRIPHGGFFDYATQAVYFCESFGNIGDSFGSIGAMSSDKKLFVLSPVRLISLPNLLDMGYFRTPQINMDGLIPFDTKNH